MKKYTYFFGVDVSKKTVDITLLRYNEQVYRQFANNSPGMNELMIWLNQLDIPFNEALFCMEATGLYCFPLTQFLATAAIDTWIEHPAQIKRSNALGRGKNDKVDSSRIAAYAAKNLDRLRLWKPASATIEKIKNLASLRERLIETKKKLLTPIREFEDMGDIAMAKLLEKSIKSSLKAIDKDLNNLEMGIVGIIDNDENLRQLYKLITSVVGIGFVTAINLIIHTWICNFKRYP